MVNFVSGRLFIVTAMYGGSTEPRISEEIDRPRRIQTVPMRLAMVGPNYEIVSGNASRQSFLFKVAGPITCSATVQITDGEAEETATSLRETATRLNKLAIDAPGDLTINRELVNTYQRLALHYQKNEQERLAEQAQNRARLAVDQFVDLLPLEPLINLLQGRDAWSVAAARRLRRMSAAPDSEIAIRDLSVIAADRHHPQRKYALAALGQMAPAAKIALPVVVAGLTDEDITIRILSAQCLKRIDPALAAEKVEPPVDAVLENQTDRATLQVGPGDWPQWGGSRQRNNTPSGVGIPTAWDVKSGTNIKWSVKLGSETYGNPVIANGKVYIGTNNGEAYLKRYPNSVDLGLLLCFDEASGTFLWQYSSPKLPTGRVHDWPMQGMPSTPLVDGQRLWATTNRGEVVCLDTEGFHDQENDGVFQEEANGSLDEADILWRFDMAFVNTIRCANKQQPIDHQN